MSDQQENLEHHPMEQLYDEIERLQKEIKFLKQLAYTYVDPTGETPEVQEYMVKLIEEDQI